MAKRIDWDSANRQARLRKWMQNHDTYSWLDEIPSEINPDIEAWAKRQSAEIVKRINRNATEAAFKSTLDLLDDAIQANDETAMKLYAQKTLNENSIRNGASREELTNLTLLVQMVLCIAE